MRVTVGLRKSAPRNVGQPIDLADILSGRDDVYLLRVFGRGRFASVETSPEGLEALKATLGGFCVFTKTPKAQAF